jgi:hypothetical protein
MKNDEDMQGKTKKNINKINYLVNAGSNIGRHLALKMHLFPKNTIYEQIESHKKDRNKGALTREDVEKIIAYSHYVDSIPDYADRIIHDIDKLDRNKVMVYQKGALLLYEVLKSNLSYTDKEIHTVANVGARVDIVSSYLAKKYPAINFISIDFNENLKEINATLPQSKNWTFINGYALDIFKEKRVIPDVVFFSSTSVMINQKELDEYFKSFSNSAKYVVFNEPWWIPVDKFMLRVPIPEKIEDSLIGGCFRMGYINYLHNYHRVMEKYGYSVVKSLIISNEKWHFPCYCLQVVGVHH